MVDIAGSSGKSHLTTILEMDPKFNCLVLQVDRYDRFKPYVIDEVNRYREVRGHWPQAIIIDVPRDEETKNLHEIYGVLEKLNDGTLTSNFKGIKKKLRMKIGVPVIVFSNSAPLTGAMSGDRWNIKTIFRTVIKKETEDSVKDEIDYFVQQAEVNSWIHRYTKSTVTWQNKVTTVGPKVGGRESNGARFESDNLLLEMYKTHTENIKKYPSLTNEEWIENPIDGSKTRVHRNGLIEAYGSTRAATLSKAPEIIVKWYTQVTSEND